MLRGLNYFMSDIWAQCIICSLFYLKRALEKALCVFLPSFYFHFQNV